MLTDIGTSYDAVDWGIARTCFTRLDKHKNTHHLKRVKPQKKLITSTYLGLWNCPLLLSGIFIVWLKF